MEALSLRGFAVLLAGLGLELVASGQSVEPVWPMANGRHDVLSSFQNPLFVAEFGSSYFHQGIDLLGNLDDVVAMRSGTVVFVSNDPTNGAFVVQVSTTDGMELDEYLHLLVDPWQVGDTIGAGDVIGRVSDRYFRNPRIHHVHINRIAGPYVGGFHGGRNGGRQLSPLAIFAGANDRDPRLLPAVPQDANEDGIVFHVSPDGEPTVRLPYAFGDVELLLEATDRQTNTLPWNQGVMGVGYWIESRAGGDDVATRALPYRLMRFDDAWRRSFRDCDALLPVMMVDSPAYVVRRSPFPNLATYRLTHAAGFQGLGRDVSPAQTWRTDACFESGAANGSGAAIAREIQEARFPDGIHRVHALTEDMTGEVESVFDVVVDNYRPYVRSFRVFDWPAGQELYRARWTFDALAGELSLEQDFPGLCGYVLRPGDQLRLEVEFSEPMASAALVAIKPELGALSDLRSSQDLDQRTLWSCRLKLATIPRATALPGVIIVGRDLAGTSLFPFASGETLAAPFNKRTDAAPLDGPSADVLHVIPLAHTSLAQQPVPARR